MTRPNSAQQNTNIYSSTGTAQLQSFTCSAYSSGSKKFYCQLGHVTQLAVKILEVMKVGSND